MGGGDPGVTPEETHALHIQVHQQIQQLPQFQQMLPVQQQQIMGTVQNHIGQHEQYLQQRAQGVAPGAGGGGGGGDQRSESEGSIVSLVRSQAQEMAQQVQRAPGQN